MSAEQFPNHNNNNVDHAPDDAGSGNSAINSWFDDDDDDEGTLSDLIGADKDITTSNIPAREYADARIRELVDRPKVADESPAPEGRIPDANNQLLEAADKPSEPVAQSPESITRSPEQKTRLAEAIEKGLAYRDRLKDPGNVSYRMMSIGAVELEERHLDGSAASLNDMVSELYQGAMGKDYEQSNDQTAQKTAGISLALECLFREGVDYLSAGVTDTADNPSGNADKNGRYAVIQWISNNTNHILAFSPEEGCSTLSYVGNDMGSSWRDVFIRAGADSRGVEHDAISRTIQKDRALTSSSELTAWAITGEIANQEYEALADNTLISDDMLPEIKAHLEKKVEDFFGSLRSAKQDVA